MLQSSPETPSCCFATLFYLSHGSYSPPISLGTRAHSLLRLDYFLGRHASFFVHKGVHDSLRVTCICTELCGG